MLERIDLRRAAAGLVVTLGAIASSPSHAQENILRVPYLSDIGSFDPDNAFEVGGLGSVNAVYEGLVEYVPGSTEIVGLLADSWEVSPDEMTYTFDLADGVTFHDGKPMTADEVLASFKRRKDNDLVLSYFLWNVVDMSAPDPDTFVIKLGMPQPSFLDTLASPWGPKVVSPGALVDHAGDDNATGYLNDNAIGTGPFKLAKFARGEEIVLEKFADYHGAAPYFDRIEIPTVPDIGQELLQLRSGEIDAVPVNYPWAQLKALPPGLEATAINSMALVMAFVKPGTVMDNPDVRTAVLTAINPALWADAAFGKYATVAESLYPIAMLKPDVPVAYPTDMEAAKKAIAAAGDVSIVIGVPIDEAPNVQRVADLMIAQLAEIGVNATAVIIPKDGAYNFASDMSKAPDIMLARNNPDAAHPETQATVFYTKGAPINVMGIADEAADAVIQEAGTKTDIAERNALYEKAGHMYFDAGEFLPLVDLQDVVVHKEGLVDLGLRPVFPPGNIDFGTVRFAE
ncbi:MAG: ABC transporter substrate-binding protein [Bauldia sp.]|nr:ABC transporter substrate-binding protein [Bauldia sp.]